MSQHLLLLRGNQTLPPARLIGGLFAETTHPPFGRWAALTLAAAHQPAVQDPGDYLHPVPWHLARA